MLPEDQRAEVRQQLRDCRAAITPRGVPRSWWRCSRGRRHEPGRRAVHPGQGGLRLPAFSSLDLGVFFEAGNLWLRSDELRSDGAALHGGRGLRYVTPVGPLAFDIGFNLDPDEDFNEPSTQFHFSIGVF